MPRESDSNTKSVHERLGPDSWGAEEVDYVNSA